MSDMNMPLPESGVSLSLLAGMAALVALRPRAKRPTACRNGFLARR
jgi:hypothetical protein